jgi:purine nucleoside permease
MKMLPLCALICCVLYSGQLLRADTLIRPKVVILTTFEVGKDTGDAPGEFQYWVEREKLDHSISIPGLSHPVLYNDAGVYGVVTGTNDRSGLGLTAAIAGVDPNRASVGSAAWACWVVDGDNAREFDGHDAPKDWPYGILAMGALGPNQPPGPIDAIIHGQMAFELDRPLVDWAFHLTQHVGLTDTAGMEKLRAKFVTQPDARKPPFVLEGDSLGTARFWHGPALNRWAEDWVAIYTHGQGRFVMTDCEDQSISYALSLLGKAGKVDPHRYFVLRTASNYSEPPPGTSMMASLLHGEESGALLAFESAYRVGSPVVHELVNQWPKYETTLPGH